MKNEKERKDLVQKLHDSFKSFTDGSIKFDVEDIGIKYGGWIEIQFRNTLNCDDLDQISKFIRKKFSSPGLFSHLHPKMKATQYGVALVVQDSVVQKFIEEGKI
jgi:hypothetical protein